MLPAVHIIEYFLSSHEGASEIYYYRSPNYSSSTENGFKLDFRLGILLSTSLAARTVNAKRWDPKSDFFDSEKCCCIFG
jgi:hypothetical protein